VQWKTVLDANGAQVAGDEWYEPGTPADPAPEVDLDTTVPHIARIYDYWLGGKDNFEADRIAGQRAMDANPALYQGVHGNRAFLARSLRFLAGEAGIRQFLDIGTGIPTANNTHEVAQSVAPQSRVVYVDNDPVVLAHARALLTSTSAPTSYVDADARDTGKILAAAAETLDLSQPVGLMMIAVLHCIPDDSDPYGLVGALVAALPSGSYLAISHPASDINTDVVPETMARLNAMMPDKLTFRSRDEVARFFTGLDLVEPGLVRIPEWRPDSDFDRANPAEVWGGVARKP
jgi:trans-aconitate methyltransferase